MKNKYLKQKLKIARRASTILQLVPYVRLISLCNSVAKGNPKKDSDIDFFIVAKDKHIFTARYAAIFFLTLLGMKIEPKKGKIKDRICLSLFLSSSSLNLDRLNLNKKEEKMRAEWILNTYPLFDEGNTYLDFLDKNSWVKRYYPNYYLYMTRKTKDIKLSYLVYVWRKLIELIFIFGIGWIVENIVRYIQIKRLLRFKHSHHGEERMIINDQIIKLHFIPSQSKKPLF